VPVSRVQSTTLSWSGSPLATPYANGSDAAPSLDQVGSSGCVVGGGSVELLDVEVVLASAIEEEGSDVESELELVHADTMPIPATARNRRRNTPRGS